MAQIAFAHPFKQKIECRTARLGVIGLGYVGLPLAMLYSRAGFRVTGFNDGRSHDLRSTPLNEHQEPDMRYIENTARALAPHLHPGQIIILVACPDTQ
jgi:UDP-N-acetyl-D-glucosamine dehydrogenase